MVVAAVAALLALGWAGVVGAVFAAWGLIAVFEILMASRNRGRAVPGARARDEDQPSVEPAPDAPAVAIVAEPGDAPPPPAAEPDAEAGVGSQQTGEAPRDAAATDEPADAEERPVPVARGAFDPVVGAPDAGPLPVPPPLAVPPPQRDDDPEGDR